MAEPMPQPNAQPTPPFRPAPGLSWKAFLGRVFRWDGDMTLLVRPAGLIHRILMSQIGQNIISNYLSVIWVGGLSLALMPVYLRLLGPAQWGLVAVCISIQAFMSLLDLGLGQIMPRDVALVADRGPETARTFLLFSRAYFGLGCLGFAIGQAAVPWIAESWIHPGPESTSGAVQALRLVLVQFLFQFANNAHTGYWNGVQAQRLANLRQCAFATAKHFGALMTILAWKASAVGYLLPFVVVSAAEYAGNRRIIRREIDKSATPKLTLADFRSLSSEAGWLAMGVLIGMLVSQIDRIVLSHAVDLASFGRYVIVANLGLAFMQLQYPLVRAYFPRIVQAEGGTNNSSVRRLAVGILALCVLPCALVALFAPLLLEAWIRDSVVVTEGTTAFRFILGAVAVNAMYQLIYQRMLSRGLSRLIFKINLVVLFAVTPIALLATQRYGIAGAGLTWLVGSLVQLSLGLLLYRRGSR
jgi:O-antigen/teichoic acid export membrane protein